MTSEARIAEQEAENTALRTPVRELSGLREQVSAVLARVRELEARAGNYSDRELEAERTTGRGRFEGSQR